MPHHASPRAFRATPPSDGADAAAPLSIRRGILPPPPSTSVPPSAEGQRDTMDMIDAEMREPTRTIPAPPPNNEVPAQSYFRTMRSPPPDAEPESEGPSTMRTPVPPADPDGVV
jgi:hypothetical protein